MTAAAVWSLLIPACEFAKSRNIPEWLPCAAGFSAGVAFLVLTDSYAERKIKDKIGNKGTFMLVFAVTLHNIPEGMAVGAALAGVRAEGTSVALATVVSLCIGIAVQNIPEGAVVSAPVYADGKTKNRSFLSGVLSGAVEPVGAVLTLLLTSLILPLLSFLLAFAAGAMVYAVFSELAPEINTQNEKTHGGIFAATGFAVMMLLDIALG